MRGVGRFSPLPAGEKGAPPLFLCNFEIAEVMAADRSADTLAPVDRGPLQDLATRRAKERNGDSRVATERPLQDLAHFGIRALLGLLC